VSRLAAGLACSNRRLLAVLAGSLFAFGVGEGRSRHALERHFGTGITLMSPLTILAVALLQLAVGMAIAAHRRDAGDGGRQHAATHQGGRSGDLGWATRSSPPFR
jgi:hypothetical protein